MTPKPNRRRRGADRLRPPSPPAEHPPPERVQTPPGYERRLKLLVYDPESLVAMSVTGFAWTQKRGIPFGTMPAGGFKATSDGFYIVLPLYNHTWPIVPDDEQPPVIPMELEQVDISGVEEFQPPHRPIDDILIVRH